MSAAKVTDLLYLKPYLSPRPWAGDRLARLYGKPIAPDQRIGETWELADRTEAQSIVSGGPHDGANIRQLLEADAPGILGELAPYAKRFPLLVKYIDAGDDLSVQVHPDDDGARAYSDRGKTECWIVVYAEPGAKIIRGLKPGVTRAAYEKAVRADRVEDVLHAFVAKVGDVLALPPGMVHALGAGLVVAEVQQNSDLTFRIYDYKRVGLDGKLRQLHVEQALQAIRFDDPGSEFAGDMRRDTVVPLARQTQRGVTTEELLQGRYFELKRHTLLGGSALELPAAPQAPRVLMAIAGNGSLDARPLPQGQTVLLPAACGAVSVRAAEGQTLTLLVSVPKRAAC